MHMTQLTRHKITSLVNKTDPHPPIQKMSYISKIPNNLGMIMFTTKLFTNQHPFERTRLGIV